jgi:hypothetical protein
LKRNGGGSPLVLIPRIDSVQPLGPNRDLIEVTSAGEPIRDCRVKRSRGEGVEQFGRREGAELKPQSREANASNRTHLLGYRPGNQWRIANQKRSRLLPGYQSAHFAGPLESGSQIIKHRLDCANERLPGVRDGRDAFSVPLKEKITSLVLELLHRSTQIGLSNIQARRSLAKMKVACHGQDELDFSEITVKMGTHVSPASNEVVFLRGQRG